MVFDVSAIANGEAAIHVLGQSSFTTSTAATTQSGLRNPSGAAFDSGTSRLFVADTNNHRVMVFDAAALTNGENAINVLGQTSFTAATAATTQSGMRNPQGASIDPLTHTLFVADTSNHRVTVYDMTAITNGENATGVLGQANFTSGTAATAQNRMSSPRGVSLLTVLTATASIAYDYDPLYRLTAADYDDGTFFHYTYDAVGNRLTEVTQAGTTTYGYDLANRLTTVNAVTYTWDNNGNLLSDGASSYTYTHANRLASVVQGDNSYTFAYRCNGKSMGPDPCGADRASQTVNGVTTTYVLDQAADLTQVLSDGTNVYLYGMERISEEQPAGWQYHLGDALGSVRQLANSGASVTLARGYEPFGESVTSTGTGSTVFRFASEQVDATELMYLRARFYAPRTGRFLSRDVWQGDAGYPASFNHWIYVYGNPVNATDPSGRCRSGDAARYQKASEVLQQFPSLKINMGISIFGCGPRLPFLPTYWTEDELAEVQRGLQAIDTTLDVFGNSDVMFPKMFGGTVLTRMTLYVLPETWGAAGLTHGQVRVLILDEAASQGVIPRTLIHEFGHVLDPRGPNGAHWNEEFLAVTEGSCQGKTRTGNCTLYRPGGVATSVGSTDLDEDFAETFYAVVRLFNPYAGLPAPGDIDSSRFDFIARVLRN